MNIHGYSEKIAYLICLFLISCSSNNEVVFLDYAASSPINASALEEFNSVSCIKGNSSGFNSHAKILLNIENQSAEIIAQKINAKPDQIVFTNNATMSNNISILGVAHNYPGCHFITSKIEHKGMLNLFKHLENSGYGVTYLDVDSSGNVNLEQLSRSIRNDTKLISIQTFNSEIGTIQNIKIIGDIAKKHGILFHSDAAQSFCKYAIDVKDINIDLLTISGYKIGAPKGIAALYIKDKSKLQPIVFGTGDPFFPGTKPTSLIASFASAVKNYRFDEAKVTKNFHILVSELLKINNIHVNSSTPSHVLSVSIGGVLLKDLLKEMKNYSFSAGCSCLGQGQSNVIQAIDPEGKLPSCTIRISFSSEIEPENLIEFVQTLKKTVERLRGGKTVRVGCQSENETDNLNNRLNKIKNSLNL
jgi:cysteine desulfurase